MIDYEKYEVQSADCNECKCKECTQNDVCESGCKLCVGNGVTNQESNRAKQCCAADQADQVCQYINLLHRYVTIPRGIGWMPEYEAELAILKADLLELRKELGLDG